MKHSTLIGFDLAKNIFHLVEVNHRGKQIRRKSLRRAQVTAFFANQATTHIAMEACSGAHYWARCFQQMGHTVSILPPQHVTAYRRGQKNDYNDATAIAQACLHGSIRPIRVKTPAQHDDQTLLRIRRAWIDQRTALCNQLRGILAEYGIVFPRHLAGIRRAFSGLLEPGHAVLSEAVQELLSRQYQHLQALDKEIQWYDTQLAQRHRNDELSQRLAQVPGIGVVVASAFKAWVGDGQQFQRGRDAAAALGLVPRQNSSGGKQNLGAITKRGDPWLRSVFVHGARSVVSRVTDKTDRLSLWIKQLLARRGFNKTVVALANKIVRIAWVIVARNESYRAHPA